MHIPRHKIDREAVQRRFDRTVANLPLFLDTVGRTPDNLPLLASNALDIVACGSVVAPDWAALRPALGLAARATAALFAVASAETLPVEVPVTGGAPTRYAARPQSSLIHPARWLQGFFLAALCRDDAALGSLAGTPPGLLRVSTTRCPEYMALFVEAIRGFREGAPETGKRLLRAMEATDPERPDVAPDWALYIDVPKIELFYRFATGDDAGFVEALPRAVERHRDYWSKRGRRDAARDPDGFLALGPLGLAALAYDRGVPIAVDSDYFPLALVTQGSPRHAAGGGGQ